MVVGMRELPLLMRLMGDVAWVAHLPTGGAVYSVGPYLPGYATGKVKLSGSRYGAPGRSCLQRRFESEGSSAARALSGVLLKPLPSFRPSVAFERCVRCV